MPLKVIGAGLGRTGTLSLKVALEKLGFDKCYHMTRGHRPSPSTSRSGTPPGGASRSIGRHCSGAIRRPSIGRAATSTGSSSERYPEAKVILTVRDPERWYDSARQTIYAVRPPSRAGGCLPGCAASWR